MDTNFNYWASKFQNNFQKSKIPADFFTPAEKSENMQMFNMSFENEVAEKIEKVSNGADVAKLIIFLSAVTILIKKYTNNQKIAIGVPIFRQHENADYLSTVLPMLLETNETLDFKTILGSIKTAFKTAIAHQNFDFKKFVEYINQQTGSKEFPLFDVALLFDNVHEAAYLNDISHALSFHFYEEGASIGCNFYYDANKYSLGTIEILSVQLQTLLQNLLTSPQTPINEIKMIGSKEQDLLQAFSGSCEHTISLDQNIVTRFKEQVVNAPHNPAITFEGETLDYKTLDEKSDQLCAYLQKHINITSQDVIAVAVPRSLESVISFIAILKAGGIYLPVAEETPLKRLEHIINSSNCKAVLVDKTKEAFPEAILQINISKAEVWNTTDIKTLPKLQKDAPAYIIYTSGSTGLPKGVLGSHGNVLNLVAGLQKAVYAGLAGFQHVSMVAPFEFDASIQQLFGSLLQGHHLHIVPATVRMDGAALVSYYLSNNITLADGTPSHLRLMLEGTKEPIALERLSMLIAGELFPRELALAFYDHFGTACTLYNLYGPTEACVDSTYHRIEYSALVTRSVLSIGRPLFNQTMYVLDTFGAPQPAGVPGELYIGGFGVTLGYVGASASEEARFEADRFLGSGMMYRTGDVARWNAEGQLEYMGRMDRQVKLRGYRIELGEVESVLNGYEGLSRSVVVAEEGTTGEKQLNSYLVVDPLEYPVLSQLVKMECEKEGTGDYVELPNGLPMYYIDDKDIHNIYKEVFEEEIYLQEGIILSPGDTIIDIGANIGMFSLFSHLATEKACAIHAIEPITEIREVLKKNVRLHNVNAKVPETNDTIASVQNTIIDILGSGNNTVSLVRISNTSQDELLQIIEIFEQHPTLQVHTFLIDVSVLKASEKEFLPLLKAHKDLELLHQHSHYLIFKSNKVNAEKSATAALSVNYSYYGPLHIQNAIKQKLVKTLPSYMIPSTFKFVTSIPLTHSGKTDLLQLGKMPAVIPSVVKKEENVPDLTKQVLAIWQTVLGKEDFGINDNFFAIGGDSIRAIRIVARMKKEGLHISLKEFYEGKNIEDITPLIKQEKAKKTTREMVTGNIPLLPIQLEFFEEINETPQHYNQSLVIELSTKIARTVLENLFTKLTQHHDALRISFAKDDSGSWQQNNQPANNQFLVHETDLSGEINPNATYEQLAQEAQETFKFNDSSLMRVDLFQFQEKSTILITLHHLICDGVSWRILLEDIQALFANPHENLSKVLEEKTNSYKDWAVALVDYTNSSALKEEIPYWKQIETNIKHTIKIENKEHCTAISNSKCQQIKLSKEITALLLTTTHEAYKTEINDILMAALGTAFADVFGVKQLPVMMEGHGREPLFKNIDVSRTVGWFTCTYPVILDLADTNTPVIVPLIKEKLRKVPNKGIGYGIIKYLSNIGDEVNSTGLKPQVLFNYLGQFDEVEDSPLGNVFPFEGKTRSDKQKQIFDFDFSAIVSEGALQVSVSYLPERISEKVVSSLMQTFKKSLEEIVDYCNRSDEQHLTPSDLTIKGLSLNELKEIF